MLEHVAAWYLECGDVCKTLHWGSNQWLQDGIVTTDTSRQQWLPERREAHYDLLKDIRMKIKKSPLTWTGRWVEGHQDDQLHFDDLDRWSQLNVECDGLAKDYWNACTESDYWLQNRGFEDEGWSVWIEGKKLTQVDKHTLYDYAFSPRTKDYWSKKHHLTEELITNIN